MKKATIYLNNHFCYTGSILNETDNTIFLQDYHLGKVVEIMKKQVISIVRDDEG